MPADSESRPIRLVAGLGNPGRKYEDTRHNVGFLVLDKLGSGLGERWANEKKWETQILRSSDVFYLKPQTFMNLSGKAIAAVAKFYKIAPEQLLVIYDDVDLPLGRLRLRADGSAGGHNGIKSIIECLGTREFPRIRVGIGRSEQPAAGTVGHVLGKFADEDREKLEKSLQDAVAAVECALSRGLDSAMNQFNRREKAPKKKQKQQPKPEPADSEPPVESKSEDHE
ncbi:MAG: PTH1 family peptidyl-tRNA hydrolase [Verrucomicrobiales bacterium]|jgi:PTH1 family peptidyl-tRNA hydrolase